MKKYNGKGLKCQDRNTEITTSYRDRQNRFNIGKLTWYIADNRWEQREAKSKLKPPSPLHPPSSTSSHWGAHGSRELRLLPSPCSPQHHSQLGSAQRWVPLEPTPGLGQLLGSAQRSPLQLPTAKNLPHKPNTLWWPGRYQSDRQDKFHRFQEQILDATDLLCLKSTFCSFWIISFHVQVSTHTHTRTHTHAHTHTPPPISRQALG